MREFFKGLSLIERGLFLLAIILGAFLRFYDLEAQSPWTDELASWYYLRNLSSVFYLESHSPLYYFLLKIFLGSDASVVSIRYFTATLSVLNIALIFSLGCRFMERRKLLLLIILLSFNPPSIVYARMARHYSFLLEGGLLFLFLIRAHSRTWIVSLYALFLSFIHVFAILPVSIILILDYLKSRNLRRVVLIFSSSLGILIYYFVRIIVLGTKEVASNVSWNHFTFPEFILGLINQFFGGAYPRDTQFYLNPFLTSFGLGGLLLYILLKKKDSMKVFFFVLMASVLAVEVFHYFGLNLRVNRYLIYTSGFLIYAICDAASSLSTMRLSLIFVLVFGLLIPLKLTNVYSWDNEVIDEWKEVIAFNPEIPRLECVNPYQASYYGLEYKGPCRDTLGQVNLKEPLLYLDLNNNNKALSLYLAKKMELIMFKDMTHSTILHLGPR